MAAAELENRTDRLFGRDADLNRLRHRALQTGLTAIVGAPQIGKSWLLMELARWLDRESEQRRLVGYTRSPKGANDPLLQVVNDLYQRWLVDASARQQVDAVWEQQKDRLLPAFAKFVGKISEKTAKLLPLMGELLGTAIKESLEGLVVASEDLRSGRLIVSRLEYTEARELVSSVHNIAGRGIALVMDQWEETRDLDQQRNTFRDFLREPEQWPECHILLGVQEGEAAELLRELEREFPAAVRVYKLDGMDLELETERRRLIAFLRAQPQLRAIENVDDRLLLDLINGYPRVITRWIAEDAHETVRTLDGLKRLAQEANEFRYRDLEKLLLALEGDRRKLAVRVALVPLAEDADAWRTLRQVVLSSLEANTLDDLKLANILDKGSGPPKFGHATRRDAARTFLEVHRQEAVRSETEDLVLALARSISTLDPSRVSYAAALRSLQAIAREQNLGALPQALCDAAARLFRERVPLPVALIEGARQARESHIGGVGFLLATALYGTLNDTKEEDHPGLRDALFNELRDLARAYGEDPAVCRPLAAALFRMLMDAIAKQDSFRRDAYLDELSMLVQVHPADTYVREPLAGGLFNALNANGANSGQIYADALLDRLRKLADQHPDDARVRELLAKGLFKTLSDIKSADGLIRRNALLNELRELAHDYPSDAAVRELLARGLVIANTLRHPNTEGDTTQTDISLEFCSLAGTYPDDASVRRHLAMHLSNNLVEAQAKGDVVGCDELLQQLRLLSREYPSDEDVRHFFAKGIFDAANVTEAEGGFTRRDALLDELRELAGDYPDDAREPLINWPCSPS